jgi:hypothetical protein
MKLWAALTLKFSIAPAAAAQGGQHDSAHAGGGGPPTTRLRRQAPPRKQAGDLVPRCRWVLVLVLGWVVACLEREQGWRIGAGGVVLVQVGVVLGALFVWRWGKLVLLVWCGGAGEC